MEFIKFRKSLLIKNSYNFFDFNCNDELDTLSLIFKEPWAAECVEIFLESNTKYTGMIKDTFYLNLHDDKNVVIGYLDDEKRAMQININVLLELIKKWEILRKADVEKIILTYDNGIYDFQEYVTHSNA